MLEFRIKKAPREEAQSIKTHRHSSGKRSRNQATFDPALRKHAMKPSVRKGCGLGAQVASDSDITGNRPEENSQSGNDGCDPRENMDEESERIAFNQGILCH